MVISLSVRKIDLIKFITILIVNMKCVLKIFETLFLVVFFIEKMIIIINEHR